MEEVTVTGLYTDKEALAQVQKGLRTGLPVRTDRSMFASPIKCRVIADPSDTGLSDEQNKIIAFVKGLASHEPVSGFKAHLDARALLSSLGVKWEQ